MLCIQTLCANLASQGGYWGGDGRAYARQTGSY
jgi:hypothetical protein